jgi:hypothetical protein
MPKTEFIKSINSTNNTVNQLLGSQRTPKEKVEEKEHVASI